LDKELDEAKLKTEEHATTLKEDLKEFGEKIGEKAREVGEAIKDTMAKGYEKVKEFVEGGPLVDNDKLGDHTTTTLPTKFDNTIEETKLDRPLEHRTLEKH